MKKFDWEKFRNKKIDVHCKTEEEAKDFCQKMHEHGMKWKSGDSCLDCTNYELYGENSYYYATGKYARLDGEKEHGYTTLEWSDYMHYGQ